MTDDTRLLDEIESSLAQQLDLARAGNFGRMDPLIQRVDELAGQLAPTIERVDDQQRVQLDRIAGLHRKLCLALAAEKHQAAQQLKKMRSGKQVLRVYRSSTGM